MHNRARSAAATLHVSQNYFDSRLQEVRAWRKAATLEGSPARGGVGERRRMPGVEGTSEGVGRQGSEGVRRRWRGVVDPHAREGGRYVEEEVRTGGGVGRGRREADEDFTPSHSNFRLRNFTYI